MSGRMDRWIWSLRLRFLDAEVVDPFPRGAPAGWSATRSAVSQMSQMSQLAGEGCAAPNGRPSRYPKKTWTHLQVDLFEERAAILEYDAGYDRDMAELLAALMVECWSGKSAGPSPAHRARG